MTRITSGIARVCTGGVRTVLVAGDDCKAEARLQAQAQAILQGRSDAIQSRVEAKLAASEDDRQKRVLAKLQPIIEDECARLEAHERWKDGQRFRGEAEAEDLSEIIRDLQSKGA